MITDTGDEANAFYQILSIFLMLLIITKTVMSIGAVQRYTKNKQFSKTGRVLFIIGFGLICLVAIGLLLMCVFVIVPEEFFKHPFEKYGPSLKDLLMDISFFVATICAINIAIFDLVLLKAIRTKNEENLLSFELDETNKT